MSGGSMQYLSYNVYDASKYFKEDREIQDLLKDVSELLHSREWFDSGDTGYESYKDELTKFKKKWFGDDKAREQRLIEYIDTELEKSRQKLLHTINPEIEFSEKDFIEMNED